MKVTNLNAPQQGNLQQMLQTDQTEETQQLVEPQVPQVQQEAEAELPLNAIAALQAESFDPSFTSTDDEDESSTQATPAELDSVAQEVFQGLQGSPEQLQPVVASQDTGDAEQQGVPTFQMAEEAATLQVSDDTQDAASAAAASSVVPNSTEPTNPEASESDDGVFQGNEAAAPVATLEAAAAEESTAPRLEGTDLPPPMPNLEGSELPPPQPTTLLEANPLPTRIADLDSSAQEMLSDLQDRS